MRKAIREAKKNTNWANPNQDYESAVARFAKAVLESKEFWAAFCHSNAKPPILEC